MPTAETLDGPIQAAIVAVDDGLGASLVVLLRAHGLRAQRIGALADLTELQTGPLEVVLVDWSLMEGATPDPLTALRQGGWQGLAIIMAENEAILVSLSALETDSRAVLIKPFAADDLLALLRPSSAGTSSEEARRVGSM